jgi:proteasome lid subunit RPN8/RPN11
MQIRHSIYDDIVAWSRSGYPHEVVALLLGHIDDLDEIFIVNYVPVANHAADVSTHFVLDPQGWLVADARAQALGLEIIGIVHTHPDATAHPSTTDIASAELLGIRFAYLIASVTADEVVVIHAWRWDGRQFMLQRLLCH